MSSYQTIYDQIVDLWSLYQDGQIEIKELRFSPVRRIQYWLYFSKYGAAVHRSDYSKKAIASVIAAIKRKENMPLYGNENYSLIRFDNAVKYQSQVDKERRIADTWDWLLWRIVDSEKRS